VHPPVVQPPPTVGWRPPRPQPTYLVALVLLVVLLVVFSLVAVAVLSGWAGWTFAPLSTLIAPFCGVFVLLLVLIVAAASGAFGRQRASLPPPPPIQQPMVPAGIQGPIPVNCPNCGAPPTGIDRFGVATCTHCGTRFIVR